MKFRFPRFNREENPSTTTIASQPTAEAKAPVTEKPVAAATPQAAPEPETAEAELPVFGPNELASLNSAALDYLHTLSATEIQRRVNAVSVDSIDSAVGIEAAAKLLDEEGIVIVRDFLASSELISADGAISRVVDALAIANSQQNYEDDEILVQSAEAVVKGYSALASHPKTVVTVRKGADAGMVDVFNVDRLAGSQKDALRAPFQADGILQLIAEGDQPLEPKNLNLYVNRGITHTRGFHADSFVKSLKGFVYLSDVTSLDHGPYSFVRRTHVDGPWRKANQKISELAQAKTEAPFIDISMVVPVLAPRGSLILSDQAGIHRGIPQAPDAERRVLVMRYR